MSMIDIDVTRAVLSRVVNDRGKADTQVAAPEPSRILCLNRNDILLNSRAGKFMLDQVKVLTAEAEAEFKVRSDQFTQEAKKLNSEPDHADPQVQSEIDDYNRRTDAFQRDVSQRQTEIDNGVAAARSRVEQVLAPIVTKIMRDHGANILVDRNAVVIGMSDIDITAEAIEALDVVLPAPRVERLKAAPPK
ncbi:MAG: OmpH family outer membrane protein [Proteobacteria bacterium]|nr:OmpH family outer membrane protein [Pseudomonadota bacterium]